METHTGRIDFRDQMFSYTEGGKTRVLLDCTDYFANKSRIPMHSYDENELTIPVFLTGLKGMYKDISGNTDEEGNEEEILLITVETVSKLIRSALPVKAVELGCTSGVLSYFLAQVLGVFNPESSLCCVTDVIGNSSGNRWLDRISMAENLPKLSMLAADYDDTQLESGYFDLVVVNGTSFFEKPDTVIREAERLVKKGGLILAYCCDSPFLENCFRLDFPERREYHLQADTWVLAAERTWEQEEEGTGPVWGREVREYLEQVKELIEKDPDPKLLMQAAKKAGRYIDDAMEMGEPEWKIRLLYARELLLDCRFGGRSYVREGMERIWPV